MATRQDRVKALLVGTPLLAAGLAIAWYPFSLLTSTTAGWTAVGAGMVSLVGLTAALGAVFLFILPAILPLK